LEYNITMGLVESVSHTLHSLKEWYELHSYNRSADKFAKSHAVSDAQIDYQVQTGEAESALETTLNIVVQNIEGKIDDQTMQQELDKVFLRLPPSTVLSLLSKKNIRRINEKAKLINPPV
jgi:hypothetical protein